MELAENVVAPVYTGTNDEPFFVIGRGAVAQFVNSPPTATFDAAPS